MSQRPLDMPSDRAQRLERLLAVGRALTSELDLDVLLERICSRPPRADRRALRRARLLDERPARARAVPHQRHRRGRQPGIGELPRGRGILGAAHRRSRAAPPPDVAEHPRSYGFPPGHPPMRTLPRRTVMIRGEAWGNLYLTEQRGRRDFDEDDEEAIVVLADWAARRDRQRPAVRRREQRRDELERAVRGARGDAWTSPSPLGGETDLDRILELIVKRGRALVEADALMILLRDGRRAAGGRRRGRRPAAGHARPDRGLDVGPRCSSAARRADRRRRRPVRIGAATRASRTPAARCVVPLVFRGSALGVLVGLRPPRRATSRFGARTSGAALVRGQRRHRGRRPRTVEEQRLRDSLDGRRGRAQALGARAARRDAAGPRRPEARALRRALRADPERGARRSTRRVGQIEPRSPACGRSSPSCARRRSTSSASSPRCARSSARTAERYGLEVEHARRARRGAACRRRSRRSPTA